MSKERALYQNAIRDRWIRIRVNEHEEREVEKWLVGLTPKQIDKVSRDIAQRLAEHKGGFPSVPALIRCILGLPEIGPGAPLGNQNHAGKPGANDHTKKAAGSD